MGAVSSVYVWAEQAQRKVCSGSSVEYMNGLATAAGSAEGVKW